MKVTVYQKSHKSKETEFKLENRQTAVALINLADAELVKIAILEKAGYKSDLIFMIKGEEISPKKLAKMLNKKLENGDFDNSDKKDKKKKDKHKNKDKKNKPKITYSKGIAIIPGRNSKKKKAHDND